MDLKQLFQRGPAKVSYVPGHVKQELTASRPALSALPTVQEMDRADNFCLAQADLRRIQVTLPRRYASKHGGKAPAVLKGAGALAALASVVAALATGPMALAGLAVAGALWLAGAFVQTRRERTLFNKVLERAAAQQARDEAARPDHSEGVREPANRLRQSDRRLRDGLRDVVEVLPWPPTGVGKGVSATGCTLGGKNVQAFALLRQDHQGLKQLFCDDSEQQAMLAMGVLRSPNDGLQRRAALKQSTQMPWYPRMREVVRNRPGDRHKTELGPDWVASKVIAFCSAKHLYIANQGACRAILCKAGAATRLSVDHVDDEPSEDKRLKTRDGLLAKHGLTRALVGLEEEGKGSMGARAQVSRVPLSRAGGEWVVLLNPEMTRVFKDSEVAAFLAQQPAGRDRQEIMHGLAALAEARGASNVGFTAFQTPSAAQRRAISKFPVELPEHAAVQSRFS